MNCSKLQHAGVPTASAPSRLAEAYRAALAEPEPEPETKTAPAHSCHGIALAQGFKSSGLSDVIAGQLVGVTVLPEFLMILVICLFVTFLTEVTSNTAITVLLMPILAAAGQAADMDPAKLMVPAAMSASCAFMMPVATAPNAVVYGTGRIPMKRMNLEGFALNVAGALLITSITVVAL